jgi:hypothetical protein
MDKLQKYRVVCLASALALWSSVRQIYAMATVGLILVLSLPFLLFAFVTTLLNHIEFVPLEEHQSTRSGARRTAETPSGAIGTMSSSAL